MLLKSDEIICLNFYVYVHFNVQIFRFVFIISPKRIKVRAATSVFLDIEVMSHVQNRFNISLHFSC